MTTAVRHQFTALTRSAFHRFINSRIDDRLALARETEESLQSQPHTRSESAEGAPSDADGASGIVTTEEEREAYLTVKVMLRGVVDPGRVVMRDVQSYFSVLLDDNNRKPICRFHFNSAQKYLGLFDAEKRETRVAISDLDDLLNHAEKIAEAVRNYADLD